MVCGVVFIVFRGFFRDVEVIVVFISYVFFLVV